MTRTYAVPDAVQASQRRRELARNRLEQCAGDAGRCRLPAKHASNGRGGAWCDTHWGHETSTAPCGCTETAGRRITDPVLHDAWHRQADSRKPVASCP